MDLAKFLRDRLDEDEAAAREAADGDSGQWFMGDKWNVHRVEQENWQDEPALVCWGNVKPQSEHIARHDPARVLREAGAKRKIVADAEAQPHYYVDGDTWFSCGLAVDPSDPGAEPGSGCADDDRRGRCDCTRGARADRVRKVFAAIAADHSDFDPAWKE